MAARLLMIEDDPDIVRASQLLFAHPELTIDVASNGVEGLRKARRTRPRAILLDYRLPILDGFEVFRAVRADPALAATRVIFLSAFAHPAALERARELGAHACFRKPFRPEALRGAVLEAVGLEEIPAHAEAADEAAGEGPEAIAPLRIAVVDPDGEIAGEVEAAVAEVAPPGTTVEHHTLGVAALAAFRASPPDVVVAEMRLPDLHGANLVRLMKRSPRLAGVPVIGLAPCGGRNAAAAALAAGVDAVVFKPIDRGLLACELRHAYIARIGAASLGAGGVRPGPRAA